MYDSSATRRAMMVLAYRRTKQRTCFEFPLVSAHASGDEDTSSCRISYRIYRIYRIYMEHDHGNRSMCFDRIPPMIDLLC